MKKRVRRNGRPITHEQWIEIMQEDGKTVSKFYPPNDEFERLMHEMDPKPDLLYRRLNFLHDVPAEYNWVEPIDYSARTAVSSSSAFCLPTGPYIKVVESIQRHHHVISAPNTQTRPAAWGSCHCPACTEERQSGKPSRFRSPPTLFP